LSEKPVPERLPESIPRESFRPLLEHGYAHNCKSNAGRKRIDLTILFKMLILQQLFSLSHEELGCQLNTGEHMKSFLGLA
jgi:transposase, IS5 family